ncbi:leucyl aminopeptidase family protein [Sneathiella sp. P13V-1]|uniref:leucyl aminopeptidase family protein n=1 Tax=Sneathiella sp. P13V-1 TaxID=2697366 RepID=UPI00187B59C6|nr:leucyl aminopeptidase family protein [Sneathiella sp. P13V-1]MBE7635446.1 leucyl aminopeptidase family protein [Sneathiella sp. P13V-1]
MIPHIILSGDDNATPIQVIEKAAFSVWLEEQSELVQNWISAQGFEEKAGKTITLPNEKGEMASVVFILSEDGWNIWSLADLPKTLPVGSYVLEAALDAEEATAVTIGWSLGTYQFDRYKSSDKEFAKLVLPAGADADEAARQVHAINLARDLINIPAGDMGPKSLEAAVSQIAGEFEARQMNVVGNDLLTYHYPMVHAVGRASAEAPRLIDMVWGDSSHPKVTIVGKGVCFDTGGLDLKPSSAMLLMKKDMGGAANALALAYMIMDANLPVRLRLLIPAVENAVSGNAYRPGDVLTSRSGKTVEIGNTDAEGRLVMADAITAADEEEPDLLIDMATLTGAARVAVGAEISATFTDDDELYALIEKHAKAEKDPVWRLPLWDEYRSLIDSKVADINNSGNSPFAGAITAGLFLKEFVEKSKSWVHFDIMAYNNRDRAGRPVGGEAFAIRALYSAIKEKYS